MINLLFIQTHTELVWKFWVIWWMHSVNQCTFICCFWYFPCSLFAGG